MAFLKTKDLKNYTVQGLRGDVRQLIKEANRNYENPQHWSLDSEYLDPLKLFLNDILL